MPLHQHRNAPADTTRPEPSAAETRPFSTRRSFPRAAMNPLLVQLRAHHYALRSRGLGLASSTFVRGHNNFPPLHSPTHHTGISAASPSGGCVRCCERSAFFQAIPPRRNVLFPGSLLLSLAVPPARPPLRGQGAFGSSLKGIPPPSPRPGRHPRPSTREQSRSSKSKKELYALQNRSARLANQERRHWPQAAGDNLPPRPHPRPPCGRTKPTRRRFST